MHIESTEMGGVKEILERRWAELAQELRTGDGIAIEKSADKMDEIQHASERDLAILNVSRESTMLRQVKAALRRIRDGSFGAGADEAGWLVISHGVGSMRKYCIGAFLLDRDNPTRVIDRLPEPLIKPNTNERDGCVPNVVYSCGSLVHGGQLVIPYGISDYVTTFATLALDQVLAAME